MVFGQVSLCVTMYINVFVIFSVSAITQPLLRQVLEQQRPILAPPPPPMFQNSPPPPQPVTIKQEAPSAAGGANDLVNQAMEQYRKDIEATCFKLGISQGGLI